MLTKASNKKLNLPGWQRKMIISITALDAIVFCVATLQNLPPSHKGQRVTKFCNVMLDFLATGQKPSFSTGPFRKSESNDACSYKFLNIELILYY